MLELNPAVDNFEVELPRQLINSELLDKFSVLLKGRQLIHNNLLDYLAETLQSVTIPDIIGDILQIRSAKTVMNKKPAFNQLFRVSEQTITLKFRILDGMWNYWLFRMNYIKYIKTMDEIIDNVGNLSMRFYNNSRTQVYTVTFIKNVLGGIEGQTFDYSVDTTDAQYFTVALAYDDIDFNVEFNDLGDSEVTDVDNDGIEDGGVELLPTDTGDGSYIINLYYGNKPVVEFPLIPPTIEP